MMIEVKTKYTKESFRKFQWFHLTRGGVRKAVSIVSLAVIFCSGAVLLLLMLIIDDCQLTAKDLLSLFFLILPVFYVLMPRIGTSSAFKKSPALFDMGLTFTFHEDYFTVLTTGMVSGTSDIRYEALYRAYQTKDSFYLYIQQQQSYIIVKTDFTAGTPEDFALFLEKVMPAKKYRSYV